MNMPDVTNVIYNMNNYVNIIMCLKCLLYGCCLYEFIPLYDDIF